MSPDSEACGTCDDPSMYFRLTRLADDEVRQAALFQCPSCGSLYEVFPEAKALPERVAVEVARQRFPDTL